MISWREASYACHESIAPKGNTTANSTGTPPASFLKALTRVNVTW
jgi:hypothetical protein